MDKKLDSKVKESNVSLTNIIGTAIQLPGVKVNRETFLREQFKNRSKDELEGILERGTIETGCTKEELKRKAVKLINERTLISTGASFAAGLPGGLTMAASIPADMLQYYGVALRMAQELAYLYGEGDLWNGDVLDKERISNTLILYCGVMLGSSGAAQTVRLLASAFAKQLEKKLAQKALTKTFYYPIVKSIVKAFGVKMTKNVFAKGMSKVVPVIGGVISGGLTYATMKPMGSRLAQTLEDAHFGYTEQEFEADWQDVIAVSQEEAEGDVFEAEGCVQESKPSADEVMEKIQKAKALLDEGILTEEEFAEMKARLIANM